MKKNSLEVNRQLVKHRNIQYLIAIILICGFQASGSTCVDRSFDTDDEFKEGQVSLSRIRLLQGTIHIASAKDQTIDSPERKREENVWR
jgi:hypothetical protein